MPPWTRPNVRRSALAARAVKTRIQGRCIWLREAIAPDEEDCPALQGDQTADVCIVGGGFAGMWTAIELKQRQPSLDIAIVEADICGGGPSGRNSGMVLSQWAKFRALEAFCGTAGAIALGKAFGQSHRDVAAFCRTHGIEGVAWGTTIPVVLVELGILVPYALRHLKVSGWRIAREAFQPQLLPLLALFAFAQWTSQQTWSHDDWRILIGVAVTGAAILGAALWLRRRLGRTEMAAA